MGDNFRRAMLVLGCVAVLPLACLWLASERLLLLGGQDPAVASLVGTYSLLRIPALLCQVWTQIRTLSLQNHLPLTRPGPVYEQLVSITLAKTMGTMGRTEFGAGASLAAALANVLLCTLLVRGVPGAWAGLGFEGAPLAMSLCDVLQMLVLLALARWEDDFVRAWGGGWSRDALAGWGAYLRLGFPSLVLFLVEWVSVRSGARAQPTSPRPS